MSDQSRPGGQNADRDRLDVLIGPYLPRQRVAEWLHSSEEHVQNLTARGDLVSVPDVDRRPTYPAFQFDRYDRVLPHVSWILRLLDPQGIDPWGFAVWLNSSDLAYGGLTAAEALRCGNCHRVLDAARAGYERWSET